VKLFSKNFNACDHNPPTSQTDRHTDNLPWHKQSVKHPTLYMMSQRDASRENDVRMVRQCLDYTATGVPHWVNDGLLTKLQTVQNAVRVVTGTRKSGHVKPVLMR